MQNLADAVLSFGWFLNFCTDEQMHIDDAVKQMEDLVYSIENDFTDAERAALQDAAKRTMSKWDREAEKHGTTTRHLLSAGEREFLQMIIEGRFSGWPADEDDEEE